MKKGEDLNLQDESVWRARTLKASYALRALLTELGAWLAALVIADRLDPRWPRYHLVLAIAAVMLVRMLSSHYDDRRRLRAVAAYQKRRDPTTAQPSEKQAV
jgi:hypothetical protein